ncbi:hypothetical protein T4E_10454 [Trichinella pseudospiralis]|uniref:Uncharacterized protein n=1 Tax=Trichinella pseudospiralis TaxID=6337 RepID=A0A0V0XZV2_TRIPS|nr:hypothetical protein T4E_10454 [Trichinella pseudospiralis]
MVAGRYRPVLLLLGKQARVAEQRRIEPSAADEHQHQQNAGNQAADHGDHDHQILSTMAGIFAQLERVQIVQTFAVLATVQLHIRLVIAVSTLGAEFDASSQADVVAPRPRRPTAAEHLVHIRWTRLALARSGLERLTGTIFGTVAAQTAPPPSAHRRRLACTTAGRVVAPTRPGRQRETALGAVGAGSLFGARSGALATNATSLPLLNGRRFRAGAPLGPR